MNHHFYWVQIKYKYVIFQNIRVFFYNYKYYIKKIIIHNGKDSRLYNHIRTHINTPPLIADNPLIVPIFATELDF